MKLALVLSLLLAAPLAQAADLHCNFKSSIGNLKANLNDNGQGEDIVTFTLNDKAIGTPGTCRSENSFRTSTIRCPVILNQNTRLEFYRVFNGAGSPTGRYSMVIWTNLASGNPRVESIGGSCAE